MEANYSFSSYPDSQNSSPRSRDIDLDIPAAWPDDSSAPGAGGGGTYRVKFICSYGGKIQPRTHDNQLSYVGGDTKILAVDRHIRLPSLLARLSSLSASAGGDSSSGEFTVKYQLPGEDLDALISVTNDEDLDHLMAEYDRLMRLSAKPARMRLFLFPVAAAAAAVAPVVAKPDNKWLVDALNSAPIQAAMESRPPGAGNPDFLFGLDKGYAAPALPPVTTPTAAEAAVAAGTQVPDPEGAEVDMPRGADLEKEEQQIGSGEAAPAEIQRQIQEMQRMQIAADQEQAAYYAQQPPTLEKVVPAPAAASIPSTVPTPYWTDRQQIPASAGGFQSATAADQQPVYLISGPPPTGVYSGVRQMTGQVGQGYYTVQRMMQPSEVYHRDSSAAAVYGMGPMAPPPTATKLTTYTTEGGMGMVRAVNPPGMVMPELVQMAYDNTGRPVYYTSSAAGTPTYTMAGASAVDVRQPAVAKPAAQTL